eukprot:362328-Chlamydomonas_euryale.AAC.2
MSQELGHGWALERWGKVDEQAGGAGTCMGWRPMHLSVPSPEDHDGRGHSPYPFLPVGLEWPGGQAPDAAGKPPFFIPTQLPASRPLTLRLATTPAPSHPTAPLMPPHLVPRPVPHQAAAASAT